MAELKPGEPFGLDPTLIAKIDWALALSRTIHDLRSDFIYAPHLAFIFHKAGDELGSKLKADLTEGKFNPGLPVTIEVPKSFRMRVAAPSKRLGPSFSRPGSILLPYDRLFYQALADQAAPIIDQKTDHHRSFSHKLAPGNTPGMFLPTRTCWNALQKALKKYAADKTPRYIVRIDVANFFGSLNQHTLINVLVDSAYPKSLANRLELMLTEFVGERSSRGILQGIFPSDLFGNFYLVPVDRFLDEYEVPSARYVDDIYVFVETCAPSLTNCYLFEIGTLHPLSDFGKFDSEGEEVVRRWYKLNWDESTDGVVDKIAAKLDEIVQKHLEATQERLAGKAS